MNYTHLTINERACLRDYYLQGKSYREIAKLLGRNPSTISREIRRNYHRLYINFTYYPSTAQNKYERRRRYCHRGMFGNKQVKEYIEEKLALTWSPEQIAKTPCERLKLPSFKTIYRWLYEGYISRGNLKVLRRKGKSRTKTEQGKLSNRGKSIRKRDKEVYKRQEFGHWEIDTVVSGRGKTKACFVSFAERMTRFYIAVKCPNREAESVKKVVIETLSEFPKGTVKTITTDNGKEFAKWEEMEKAIGCQIYFADPYCAWQKGTNENLNGLLREFYPKGRNLSHVSSKTLEKNLALINARPKKVLGFKKPVDLFFFFLNKCCT